MESEGQIVNPVQLFLGTDSNIFQDGLDNVKRLGIIERIWKKDHTVWASSPKGVSDRLGWLIGPEYSSTQLAKFLEFGEQIKSEGFRHLVLIGMGGSTLGAEVLNRVSDHKSGFPELILLDSTIPDSIQAVIDSINLEQTLFIISSKTGRTIETNSLYMFFRSLLQNSLKQEPIGERFIAITDKDSPLHKIALEHHFRKIILNPPDIGGRFSVLSAFGLLPATLTGIDTELLIQRAKVMQRSCLQEVPIEKNPAALLGSAIGSLGVQGRNKLTLVTSPCLRSFGIWVEQMLAESTGKDGRGIIPINDEPLSSPSNYGKDRLFLYLRLSGDENEDLDNFIKEIQISGHPCIQLNLNDKYDLSGEFYLWQFATVVAGSFLGIQPFDQPNVQQAKDGTEKILLEYERTGSFKPFPDSKIPGYLLTGPHSDTYLTIMAFIPQNHENDHAFHQIRRDILEQYQITTTFGYGPRFLHSTGQLHKGGPNNGRFLQVVTDYENDFPIPEKPYTFGRLVSAQAEADLVALKTLGRSVVRVHVRNNILSELQNFLSPKLNESENKPYSIDKN